MLRSNRLMRSRVSAFGLGLSLALATGAAHAAPTTNATGSGASQVVDKYPEACASVPRDKADAAHATYLLGKQAYDVADHATAIRRFVSAYELDCTKHELLVIISRSFEFLGNRAEAARALEEFLARAQLGDKERETVKARLANMKKGLSEAPPKPTTTPSPTPGPTPSATSSPPPAPTAPPSEVREHTIYPWLVAGVGGLALVSGLTVYIIGLQTAPSGCSTSTRTCTREGQNESEASFLDRQQKAGNAAGLQTGGLVTMIGGGVLTVGGLVWHFLEPTGPKPTEAKTPKLTPSLAPGYAGLQLGGRF